MHHQIGVGIMIMCVSLPMFKTFGEMCIDDYSTSKKQSIIIAIPLSILFGIGAALVS